MNDTPRFSQPDRRSFLQTMLIAGMAPLVLPSVLRGNNAPSKRVTLGFIGMGGQGTLANLQSFLGEPDCRVLSVCDVIRERRTKAQEMVNTTYGDSSCRAVEDFREIIADPAVDAVVISTPDHWHVPMSLMALAAGKHVFCEKPTYRIVEGRVLADAVARSGKVFQTGIEDRSVSHYHKMVEWLRNGVIGDLYHVEVTLPSGEVHPWEPEAPVPEGMNWNLWLGPAPYHPYTATRTAPLHWRYIRDYSTGILTDWGAHLVDTAQLAVNDPLVCPVEVRSWCQPLRERTQSDISPTYEVHYRYSNGITMAVRTSNKEEAWEANAGIRLLGSKGWISNTGWRGRFEASDPAILRMKYAPGESKHWPMPPSEHRNFLDVLKSGGEPTYTAETLHKLSTTLHLGLIAADLGKPVRWDPKAERIVGDKDAERFLHRNDRDWTRG